MKIFVLTDDSYAFNSLTITGVIYHDSQIIFIKYEQALDFISITLIEKNK